MVKKFSLGCVLVASAGLAQSASAAIIFSNVVISGSLSTGATAVPGPNDIDFTFGTNGAQVGDATAPVRSGNLIITFNVDSTDGPLTADILSLLGAVSGSGVVIFNEVIEDRTPGSQGIIALADHVVNVQNPPPVNRVINFSRPSSSIKVKKTLVLSALDTQALDLANVSLLEQRFVPTPGALALLGMGTIVAMRRRR